MSSEEYPKKLKPIKACVRASKIKNRFNDKIIKKYFFKKFLSFEIKYSKVIMTKKYLINNKLLLSENNIFSDSIDEVTIQTQNKRKTKKNFLFT